MSQLKQAHTALSYSNARWIIKSTPSCRGHHFLTPVKLEVNQMIHWLPLMSSYWFIASRGELALMAWSVLDCSAYSDKKKFHICTMIGISPCVSECESNCSVQYHQWPSDVSLYKRIIKRAIRRYDQVLSTLYSLLSIVHFPFVINLPIFTCYKAYSLCFCAFVWVTQAFLMGFICWSWERIHWCYFGSRPYSTAAAPSPATMWTSRRGMADGEEFRIDPQRIHTWRFVCIT